MNADWEGPRLFKPQPSPAGYCRRSQNRKEMMDILGQYRSRSEEIIGERTPDEERYDKEVVRWLRKGKPIRKAIAKANEKYPSEALTVTDDNVADVQDHYEYLVEHVSIMQKLNRLK